MVTYSPGKWIILILPFLNGILCSVGDSSQFYQNCIKICKTEICDAGKHSIYQYNVLGIGLSLWSCLENCEYKCQWQTVEAFQKKNWPVPQFKGKWPFIRFLGFQEPASVIFSIINFIATWKLLILFRKKVSQTSQFYYVWIVFSLVHLNAWFWSSVYHCRDTDLTEKLDYMSAFLTVLYSVYGVGLRYIGASFSIKSIIWSILCCLLGINHLTYLWLYNFDYGYNMKLNFTIGGIGIFLWILWSFLHFRSQPFVWKIFTFSVLICCTSLLELLDFPPIFWLVDAHSLWHCSTIFAHTFFYLFVIDDCNYLSESKEIGLSLRHKIK